MDIDTGKVWAAIRRKLPDLRERLAAVAAAQSYEAESAYFDGIARDLTDAIAREGDGRCTVMLPNEYGEERCGLEFGHEGRCRYGRGD